MNHCFKSTTWFAILSFDGPLNCTTTHTPMCTFYIQAQITISSKERNKLKLETLNSAVYIELIYNVQYGYKPLSQGCLQCFK